MSVSWSTTKSKLDSFLITANQNGNCQLLEGRLNFNIVQKLWNLQLNCWRSILMPKEVQMKQKKSSSWYLFLCCNQQDVSPWEPEVGWKHPELSFISVNRAVRSVGQLLTPPWLAHCFMPHLNQSKSVPLPLHLCWADAVTLSKVSCWCFYNYVSLSCEDDFKF